MATFLIKAGDYHRQLQLDLTDILTTGASGVTFRMRSRDGALVVDNAGTIVDASTVRYQFTAPQLATPGTYQLEAVLTYLDGPETVPTSGYVTVVIVPSLA
jgi:hypothetical protein